MKKIMTMLVLLFLAGVCAFSAEVDPHTGGRFGATHFVTVKYSDFTETTADTAETLTFAVGANEAIEWVALELVTAFDTDATNVSSCAVTVGDGTDADLYITSTELARDGTEVFWKFDAGYGVAATNAVGRKVYTSSDTVDLTFTPDAAQALSAFTAGEVRLYFNWMK